MESQAGLESAKQFATFCQIARQKVGNLFRQITPKRLNCRWMVAKLSLGLLRILALLQKLPKFLNCEQLFDSRSQLQPAKDVGKAQGSLCSHGQV